MFTFLYSIYRRRRELLSNKNGLAGGIVLPPRVSFRFSINIYMWLYTIWSEGTPPLRLDIVSL